MKILVPCKRVPNPELKLKISGGNVELAGTTWQVNPFDEYAVETALRLTEKNKGGARSGEVVVVSIGPKDASTQIRQLLAMGADRGILIAGEDAALDADLVARTLKALVEVEMPDLVILGKQTVDGDDNQVGQLLAGYLGWPQATFLSTIDVAADGKAAAVSREVDTGVEERRVRLPAIASVDLRIVAKKAVHNLALSTAETEWEDTQRLASLKGIMAAKKKELKEITAESLGVSGGILVKTLRHDTPPARKAGIKVASIEELVSKLHSEAKVI